MLKLVKSITIGKNTNNIIGSDVITVLELTETNDNTN